MRCTKKTFLSDDLIQIGKITATHGIKGDVKVQGFTEDPKGLLDYRFFCNELGDPLPLKINSARGNHTYIAHIEAINTPENASTFKNHILFAQKEHRPALQNDERYMADLIGYTVIGNDEEIGVVSAFYDYGAGLFLEICVHNSKKIATFPFNKDAIHSIEDPNKKIIVDPGYVFL